MSTCRISQLCGGRRGIPSLLLSLFFSSRSFERPPHDAQRLMMARGRHGRAKTMSEKIWSEFQAFLTIAWGLLISIKTRSTTLDLMSVREDSKYFLLLHSWEKAEIVKYLKCDDDALGKRFNRKRNLRSWMKVERMRGICRRMSSVCTVQF